MSEVFVSYAHEDAAVAKQIAESLSALGLSVFWDRDIAYGRSFERDIESALGKAKAVVVLWSEHSVSSDWVRAEAAEGADRGALVPATLDGVRPPLRHRLSQTADLRSWVSDGEAEAFDSFIQHISRQVESGVHGEISSEATANSMSPGGDRRSRLSTVRKLLRVKMFFAWIGSTSMSVTIGYDYGFFKNMVFAHMAAFYTTLTSLVLGGGCSALFGYMCLKRQSIVGVLQGWVWPIVAAFLQFALLLSVSSLFLNLPALLQHQGSLAVLLAGAIAPALLTIGALVTDKALAGRR